MAFRKCLLYNTNSGGDKAGSDGKVGGVKSGKSGSKLKVEEVIPPRSTHPVKVYTDGNAKINTEKIDIYIFVVKLN